MMQQRALKNNAFAYSRKISKVDEKQLDEEAAVLGGLIFGEDYTDR